ncbi:uncharacterized protein LOC135256346 [Anguilla rostrata]|uniref:uncharacterized protein LOC135256346 n=1 Tax=Anguilla rostrata TaxID=7938 RepID=UPI0030D0DF11
MCLSVCVACWCTFRICSRLFWFCGIAGKSGHVFCSAHFPVLRLQVGLQVEQDHIPPLQCPHLEAAMGNVMTHVANASGGPLRVYYSTDKMTLEEIEVVYGTKAGGSKSEGLSFSASTETKMQLKRDTRIRYIRIPTWDFGKILSEGNIYVTVFVENRSYDDDDCGMISENFFIPSDRSFIVTANHNIKFQKYGASLWEDEGGYSHWK